MRSSSSVRKCGKHRTADTLDVDAVMFIETLIFNRRNRLVNVCIPDIAVRHIDTVDIVAAGQLGNLIAINIIYKSGQGFLTRLKVGNRKGLRRRNIPDQHAAAKSAEHKDNQKEKNQEYLKEKSDASADARQTRNGYARRASACREGACENPAQ